MLQIALLHRKTNKYKKQVKQIGGTQNAEGKERIAQEV